MKSRYGFCCRADVPATRSFDSGRSIEVVRSGGGVAIASGSCAIDWIRAAGNRRVVDQVQNVL